MSPAYEWESNENQELAIEMLRSVSLSGYSVSTVDTRHSATKNVFKMKTGPSVMAEGHAV